MHDTLLALRCQRQHKREGSRYIYHTRGFSITVVSNLQANCALVSVTRGEGGVAVGRTRVRDNRIDKRITRLFLSDGILLHERKAMSNVVSLV